MKSDVIYTCTAPKDYKCTPYNHKTCAACRYCKKKIKKEKQCQ